MIADITMDVKDQIMATVVEDMQQELLDQFVAQVPFLVVLDLFMALVP
jgi:ribosomal protein L25 (general stress protein Ctc)